MDEPTTMDLSRVDEATAQVHENIRALLLDEYPELAQKNHFRVLGHPYLFLSWNAFTSYMMFTYHTWSALIITGVRVLTGNVGEYSAFLW